MGTFEQNVGGRGDRPCRYAESLIYQPGPFHPCTSVRAPAAAQQIVEATSAASAVRVRLPIFMSGPDEPESETLSGSVRDQVRV